MRPLLRRGLIGCAAVVSTAMVLAACGSADNAADSNATTVPPGNDGTVVWDDVVSAANTEGKVMYYSVGDPTMLARVEKAFETKYPKIDLEFTRMLPNEVQSAVDAELKTGKGIADVVATTDTNWLTAHATGGETVKLADLPNVKGKDFDSDWLREDAYVLDSPTPMSWAWNTEKFPNGIKDADSFFDPKLKGLVGIPDPVAPDTVDIYRYHEQTYGEDFLDRLAKQEPRIYPSMQAAIEALSAGEVSAILHSAPAAVQPAMDKGAPIDFVVPDEPRVLAIWATVPNSAPHPNAALVLTNFLLSKEGNEARGVFPQMLSTVDGIPGGKYAKGVQLRDIAAITTADVETFRTRFDKLFR